MKHQTTTKPVILHIIDTTGPGGAETVFIQLADKLRQKGYHSIVVIRGTGWVNDELEKRGITPFIIDAKGSFAVGFLWKLIKLIHKRQVNLIQSHLLGSNIYASIAGILSRVPVVATYHGMVDVDPNERFKWLKHKAMKMGVDRYVAVSKKLLVNISEQGLMNSAKSVVIYNGVDVKKYQLAKDNSLKNRLKLKGKQVLIGSLGNIRPAKAYDNLVKAAAILSDEGYFPHFVIAGQRKKSLMAKLHSQIESLGLTSSFTFLGFIDDSAAFLSQVDVFVLSSSSEGFSISTIEGMAAGLPVVVTRCGGPEEIVTDSLNAVIVQVNDERALADGIIKVISDRAFSLEIVKNANKHVTETFSLDSMVNEYHSLYRGLIP